LIVDRIFDSAGIFSANHHCIATWPVIYAWTGTGYSDVSNHYKSYYEKQLASLQKEIAATEQTNDQTEQASAATAGSVAPGNIADLIGQQSAAKSASVPPEAGFSGGVGLLATPSPLTPLTPLATDDQELDCTKAEAAKIERFLGVSRDAGMSDAISWAAGDDRTKRQFAIQILAEIGTPEAIEDLQTLSSDPDQNVARSAKSALLNIKTPYVHPTIQRELLTQATGATPAK